jgi:(2Fe-2S) ferredoxin
MKKPKYHIFVCNSFRLQGEPQGVCHKKDSVNLLRILEEEIIDRGLDAQVSSTGCLKVCDRGPAMVIYPQAWWYEDVDEDKLREILDALEESREVADYLMS